VITNTLYDPVDPNLDLIGWYRGNSEVTYSQGFSLDGKTKGTHAAKGKAANAWGLHDMASNVWEWAWDRYGTYPGDSTDPQGAVSGSSRVYRGGSCLNYALNARGARRGYDTPDGRGSDLGARLARSRQQ